MTEVTVPDATWVVAGAAMLAAVLGIVLTAGFRFGLRAQKKDRRAFAEQAERLERQTKALSESAAELKKRLDETEKLSDHLRDTNGRLQLVTREWDQFTYIASHDLKGPLRAIASLSEWLEEDMAAALTDSSRGHLTLLRGRVRRMDALLEGLLAYSRAGRGAFTVEMVNVRALVEEAIQGLRIAPQAITIEIPEREEIETERPPLYEVFSNLIGNAIKHGGQGELRIIVGASGEGAEREYWVTDNGPGIDARYHDRIFRVFQTLASRDRVEGAGMGLAIVKKWVEARGGSVRVDSEPGGGARFSFTWPEKKKALAAPANREELHR